MNIKILIDRIVLNVDNLSSSQRRCLQTNIETELTNLINVNGIPYGLRTGGAVSDLSVNLGHIPSHMHSAKLGYNIAYSIYRKMEER
jgi:hypothetical protein